ncbi:hypothetical protein OJAV_G00154030 [Oryzias javanicus]|uniref:Uncharacterized protein n=1 Tax=Oryzias javanicus TaxID=123683 RepID=A0A437CLJ2_ORYJA|nr:hypothetical protein OJAV_G00154030 [Oryzias javanicus]
MLRGDGLRKGPSPPRLIRDESFHLFQLSEKPKGSDWKAVLLSRKEKSLGTKTVVAASVMTCKHRAHPSK